MKNIKTHNLNGESFEVFLFAPGFARANKKVFSFPGAKEFSAMAKKTVLIQLAKMLPLSVELQRALSADETSREYKTGVGDAYDLPVITAWEEPADVKQTEATLPPLPQPTTTPPVNKPTVSAIDIRIHDLKKQLNDDTFYYETLGTEFGVEHMTELTVEQKSKFITLLIAR